MPNRIRVATLFVCAAGLMLSLSAHPTVAAPADIPFTVNSTLDAPDETPGDGFCRTAVISPAAGACTLRAAIMEANMASGAGATITVLAGVYSLTISASGGDGPEKGDLNLTTPASGNPVIRLVGAGAASTIIDANQIDRVFHVETGRSAFISGLTLRGGYLTSGSGGGILNQGVLTMADSTVTGNLVIGDHYGGGIYNVANLTLMHVTIGPDNQAKYGAGLDNFTSVVMDQSTVTSNSASYEGGGINSELALTMTRSTVDNNSAAYGAGISATYGHLVVINSTMSANSASTDGGGIYAINTSTTDIYNSTIAYNDAQPELPSSTAAGGIYVGASATVNLRNTLLAGNSHTGDRTAADCFGTVHSYGSNLFGTPSPCLVVVGSGSNATINDFNLLRPLQNNGGPTRTNALLAGSNAIDAGDPVNGCLGPSSLLDTDQRGVPRIVGASCDIGAFEFLPPILYLPLVRK